MIGSKFTGPILPFNLNDPTHISGYGKGGIHTSVDTLNDRNAIPVGKREHGMIVAVGNNSTSGGAFVNYQLVIPNWYLLDIPNRLTALADNNNWIKLIDSLLGYIPVNKAGDTGIGALQINDTSATLNSTSGALIVAGGIGVNGDISTNSIFIKNSTSNVWNQAIVSNSNGGIRFGGGNFNQIDVPGINTSNTTRVSTLVVNRSDFSSASAAFSAQITGGVVGNGFTKYTGLALAPRLGQTSSGTGELFSLEIAPVVNQSVGALGPVTGIRYAPTGTIRGTHYAIETLSGDVKIGGATASISGAVYNILDFDGVTYKTALSNGGATNSIEVGNGFTSIKVGQYQAIGANLALLDTLAATPTYKSVINSTVATSLTIGAGWANVTIGGYIWNIATGAVTGGNAVLGGNNTGITLQARKPGTQTVNGAAYVNVDITGNWQISVPGSGSWVGYDSSNLTISHTGTSNQNTTIFKANPTVSNLTVNGSIYGFRGTINNGNGNRYNLYMDGTAPNYFAGDLKIDSSTTSTNSTSGSLIVTGGIGVGGNLNVSGSVVIGSTSGTLDVSTLRILDFDGVTYRTALINNGITNQLYVGSGFTSTRIYAGGGLFTFSNNNLSYSNGGNNNFTFSAGTITFNTGGLAFSTASLAAGGAVFTSSNPFTQSSGTQQAYVVGGIGSINVTGTSTSDYTTFYSSPGIVSWSGTSGILSGFRSTITSGANRYQLYMGGTALNYFAGDIQMASGLGIRDGNGAYIIKFPTTVTNAVNYLVVNNNIASDGFVLLGVDGVSANVGFNFTTKANGDFQFNNSGTGGFQLKSGVANGSSGAAALILRAVSTAAGESILEVQNFAPTATTSKVAFKYSMKDTIGLVVPYSYTWSQTVSGTNTAVSGAWGVDNFISGVRTNALTITGITSVFSGSVKILGTTTTLDSPIYRVLDYDGVTYKTALDSSATNTLRLGNSFTTLVTPTTTLNFTGGNNVISNTTGQIAFTSAANFSIVAQTIGNANTSNGFVINKSGNIIATLNNHFASTIQASFTHNGVGGGSQGLLNLIPTINQTGIGVNQPVYAIYINPTITSSGSTQVIGLRSSVNNGTNGSNSGYNLFIDGTAPNFFAGNVVIGGSSSGSVLDAPIHRVLDFDSITYKTALSAGGSSNSLRFGDGFTSMSTPMTFFTYSGGNTTLSASNGGFTIQTGTGGQTITLGPLGGSLVTNGVIITRTSTAMGHNTGTARYMAFTGSFGGASGSGSQDAIGIVNTLNWSGSHSGIGTGLNINPSLTLASSSTYYGLRSQVSATTAGTAYNLYIDGTAPNYLAGNTIIGNSTTSTLDAPIHRVLDADGVTYKIALKGSVTTGELSFGADFSKLNVVPQVNFLNTLVQFAGGASTITNANPLTMSVTSAGSTLTLSTNGGGTANNGVTITTNTTMTNNSNNRNVLLVSGNYTINSGNTANFQGLRVRPTLTLSATAAPTAAMIELWPSVNSITSTTTLYGLRSRLDNDTSGATIYNLYVDGDAPNYLKGNLQVDGTLINQDITYTKKVTLTSAQIQTLSTSVFIDVGIPAPGVGKCIQVLGACFRQRNWTTPYVNPTIQIRAAGGNYQIVTFNLNNIANNGIEIANLTGQVSGGLQFFENAILRFYAQTTPTTGDADYDFYITYKIITL